MVMKKVVYEKISGFKKKLGDLKKLMDLRKN